MTDKPFAESCERNREPILAALAPLLADARQVLEIGSGTGQHAVYFAAALPQVIWQCSDHADHLPGMRLWLDEAALANTPAPLVLQVDPQAGLVPLPPVYEYVAAGDVRIIECDALISPQRLVVSHLEAADSDAIRLVAELACRASDQFTAAAVAPIWSGAIEG